VGGVKTVLELVWANEGPQAINGELDEYRRRGINVVVAKVMWRRKSGEAAVRKLARHDGEFEDLRNASVTVLIQDSGERHWEVTSFGQEVKGLPEGKTIQRRVSASGSLLFPSIPAPSLKTDPSASCLHQTETLVAGQTLPTDPASFPDSWRSSPT
jgi:hypothetical protein